MPGHRPPFITGSAWFVVVLATLVTACGSGQAPIIESSVAVPGATTAPGAFSIVPTPRAALVWTACGKHLQCSQMSVPLDDAVPSAGNVELFLERRPAGSNAKRIGSLLVNPGGPGIPGTSLVEQAANAFSATLLDAFDIVSWDPRGTGRSTPAIACADDLDPYFSIDPSPDTPAEMQALEDAAKDFAASCASRSGRLLDHVSTQDTARDMDAIRQALGEERISFFGFSYGSRLGATYATLFPSRVRAMVIDGAEDPAGSTAESGLAVAAALEHALDLVLQQCSHNAKCPFHNDGDAEGAFDRLMAALDRAPLQVSRSRPAVGQGVAITAIVSQLYSQDMWPMLTKALAKAQSGDGTLLLAMYDGYLRRRADGTWSNVFPALEAIDCIDDPGVTSRAEMDQLLPRYLAVAPRFGAAFAYNFTCTDWPARPAPELTLTGKGAGPIVVVGTTGDPITPLSSTTAMAAALQGGVLVTVHADQHTGYGVNDCVVSAVDRYLTALVVPAPGLVCP